MGCVGRAGAWERSGVRVRAKVRRRGEPRKGSTALRIQVRRTTLRGLVEERKKRGGETDSVERCPAFEHCERLVGATGTSQG